MKEMTELQKMQGNLVALKATLKERTRRRREVQKELDAAEDSIISIKESIRKAEEDIHTYMNTQVLTNEDEEARKQDIESFRERMPAAMKKIEEQDQQRLEREARTELDSFKNKINSSLARKVEGNGNATCNENPVA